MKALLLVVFVAVLCVVLFLVGFVSPRRSRRVQARVGRVSRKGEAKGDRNAGRVGDATRKSLERMRSAADASAEKGRSAHDKVFDR